MYVIWSRFLIKSLSLVHLFTNQHNKIMSVSATACNSSLDDEKSCSSLINHNEEIEMKAL